MKPFTVARMRLVRAEQHGKAMSDAWNAIPAENAYGIRAKVNSYGVGRLFVVQLDSIPDEISLLFGEMLYQMRSALDACIYQGAIYATGQDPPPDENSTEFPITNDPKEFPKLAKRRLSSLPPNLRDAIEKLQPYNQSPSLPPAEVVTDMCRSLSLLNALARKDRHRKLHVVGTTPIKLDPKFTFPPGVTLRSIRIRDAGVLKDGDDLAVFQLDGFAMGCGEVKVNPYLTTIPGLDEPPPPIHISDTFPIRVQEMVNTVHSIIVAFENYF